MKMEMQTPTIQEQLHSHTENKVVGAFRMVLAKHTCVLATVVKQTTEHARGTPRSRCTRHPEFTMTLTHTSLCITPYIRT